VRVPFKRVRLVDKKFGRLTIRKQIAPDIFYCDCTCGNELMVWRSLLDNHVQLDCGMCVLRPKRDGHLYPPYNGYAYSGHVRYYNTRSGKRRRRSSSEFNSWEGMMGRCYCKSHASYDNYGGRGIRVCERWRQKTRSKGDRVQGFKNSLADMGPRPKGKSLDRINPQGHYEPTNCQWADAKEQHDHQRRYLYPDGNVPTLEGYRAMEARLLEELDLAPF
jgi:hypothetical protein